MPKRKTFEEFKKEFDKYFGSDYELLSDSYVNGKTKITVKHKICGNIFHPTPNNLLSKKTGCPKCANNILLTDEEFKEKLKEKFGSDYTVLSEYHGLKKKIKIRHKCGNEFETTAENILYNSRRGGCKKCSHNNSPRRKTLEQFKNDVYALVGNEYSVVSNEYKNQMTKIWMKHNDKNCKCHGEPFLVIPKNFLHKDVRCPSLNQSKGEQKIEEYLKSIKANFEHDVSIDGCKDKIKLRFDFKVFNSDKSKFVFIEYDGAQHTTLSKNWGGRKGLDDRKKKDKIKNAFCKKNKIPLLRISYKNMETMDEIIKEFLKKEMIYDL